MYYNKSQISKYEATTKQCKWEDVKDFFIEQLNQIKDRKQFKEKMIEE